MRNVVDSSGWLEFFADSKNADFFRAAILDTENLVVPVITLFEVFKRVSLQRGEEDAFRAVGFMLSGTVIDLDQSLALLAARLSCTTKLPMADSIILATAQSQNAILWTQDEHFKDLPDVQYNSKNS